MKRIICLLTLLILAGTVLAEANARRDTTAPLPPKISFAASVQQSRPPVWQYKPAPAPYQPPCVVGLLFSMAYNSLKSEREWLYPEPRYPRYPLPAASLRPSLYYSRLEKTRHATTVPAFHRTGS